MNAIDREFHLKHGFTEDTDKKALSKLFTSNKKFKEVNISVELTEPFMLLARSKEKNVNVEVEVDTVQGKRLILESGGRCSTVIMDILLDEICNCFVKDYGGLFEFEFEVRDLCYSLHIFV